MNAIKEPEDNAMTIQEVLEKFVQVAGDDYRSFDPSRPDGISAYVDIVKGDSIIVQPDLGQGNGKCWKPTQENLRRFTENGYAFARCWSKETRTRIADIGSTLATPFGRALDVNLLGGKAPKIPNFNLPLCMRLSPVSLRFSSREDVTKKLIPEQNASGSDAFIESLQDNGVVPKREDLSRDDFAAVRQANLARVFELRRGRVLFRVFAFFVTPIDKDGNVKPADATVEQALLSFEKKVKAKFPQKPNARFVVMGTPRGWKLKEGTAQRGSDFFELRVTPPSQDDSSFKSWRIDSPSFLGAGKIYRDFVFSIFPETSETRRQRIGDYLDNEFSCFSGGTKSFSVADVAKATEDCDELVAKSFDALLKTGKYKTMHTGEGLCICQGGVGHASNRKFWKASLYGREKKSIAAKFFYEICFGLLGSFYAVVRVVAKVAQWLHWELPASVIAILFAVVIPVIKKNLDASGED